MVETERKIKTGLVMEGGAMRGMFTAGVIDVMMENGIIFDGAVGVSAGAVFGCNYKSAQIGRAIRYNKRFCNDKRYVSWSSWLKTGNLYNVDFAYHTLVNELDVFDRETFKSNQMEFYVTCTDVKTGKPVYHKCTDGGDEDIEWMRASASMPIFSRVVNIGKYKLLDGGVADSVPLRFFINRGYERNVVILTQPRGYIKEKNKHIPTAKIMLYKYPEMIKAMENRHIRYNKMLDYIDKQEKSGNALVIRPPVKLEVSGVERDMNKLEKIYQIGRRTAIKQLEQIKTFVM